MRNEGNPTGRALVASFAAVAIAFTVTLALTQAYSLRIRDAAREITANASPSIARLSSMRSTLRQLEVLVEEQVDTCRARACDPDPPRLAALRRALRDEWRRYVALPAFPHEEDSWPEVEALLARVEDAVERCRARLADGRPDAALEILRGALEPAIERLDAATARLVQGDHDEGVALAAHIDRLAMRSIRLSTLLDAVCLALTALAAVSAVRLVRRYERMQRERLDDLDGFAGRVAHDLLNPLGATLGAVELARRASDGRVASALELADRGARRAHRIVEGLLAFARGGAAQASSASASLREVVADVVDEQRAAAERGAVTLRVEELPEVAVACGAGLLTSVVANLVGNAVKFTSESAVRQVVVRAEVLPRGRVARVEVEDSGPGVPAALGERVFEPFVRGGDHRPGVGLGLATARRIVTAHGGRIGFHAGRAGGSVFWFELPLAARAARQAG